MGAVALRRAGAGLRRADVHVDDARRPPGRVLPAVDIAVESAGLGEQRRRLEIDHPAADPNAVVEAFGLGRRRRLARIARDRVLVQMRDVGVVEQIVDQELGVRLDAKIARRQGPAVIGEPGHLDDLGVVGAGRIAHPDPDDIVAFRHRVGPHPRSCRHQILTRNGDALSFGIEGQAVIAAAQVVALHGPKRQWRRAMAAAILKRRRLPVHSAEQDHLLAEKGARDRLGLEVLGPDRCIPAVLREHRSRLPRRDAKRMPPPDFSLCKNDR